MDYTVHGILQARILEWVAFPFSRGSFRPRNWTRVSCIAGGFFTSWATNTEKCLEGCTLDSWQWPLQGVKLNREEDVVRASVHAKLLQSCLTLCDPMDCSPPSSSVHGILQARLLEWVAMPSSRGSSRPRGWTHVSYITGEFFTAGSLGD